MTKNSFQDLTSSVKFYIFLQYAATGSFQPIVTIYLADKGLSYALVARFLALVSFVMIFIPWILGAISDNLLTISRLLVYLNFSASIGLLMLELTHGEGLRTLAFLLYSCSTLPIFTLSNGLIFQSITNPKEQFGQIRLLGSIGWITPAFPIAIWLYWIDPSGTDFALRLSLLLHLMSMVICARLDKQHYWKDDYRHKHNYLIYLTNIKQRLLNIEFFLIIISAILMAGASSIYFYFSPPFLEKSGLARAWIVPAQTIAVITEVILLRYFSVFLKRFPLSGLIFFGAICMVIRNIIYSLEAPLWLMIACYALGGPVVAFYNVGIWIVAELISGKEVRATTQNTFSMTMHGIGPAIANVLMYLILSTNPLRTVFIGGGILALLSSIIVILIKDKINSVISGTLYTQSTALTNKDSKLCSTRA